MNVDNCTIVQLQTKDQLTSTIGSWTKLGLQKSHTTLGEIVGLHNYAVADKGSIDKAGIKKSHDCTIVQLPT